MVEGNIVELALKEYEKIRVKNPEGADRILQQELPKCPECESNDIFNADGDWYCETCGSIDIKGE